MSFQCPQCLGLQSLQIIASIELVPDTRSDEISLQVVRCRDCRFEALAVYEESTRGALDSESVDHYGYQVARKDLFSIKSLIKGCPRPRDAGCSCASHRQLNQRDSSGRWMRPGFEPGQKVFPMRI